MPKRRANKRNMVKGEIMCKFCEKAMTKKEAELHLYVCEKVPQEIFDDGYFKNPFGGGSVSFGTNCNSSLTNPLLGAPLLR